MSKELVESILDKDFVLAESHFNDILNNIMEKKLYEKKRMVAAQMDEALGGMTRAEIEAKKKAGYKKASDVLQDPRDIKIKPLVKVKKDKKKVSEAVEVKPDPEGRVRGGKSSRPVKGTFGRKVGAATIKAVRKGSRVAGDIGAEVAGRVRAAKQAYQAHKAAQAAQQDDSYLRKTFGVEKSKDKKRPGIIRRNVNTLMGRQAGYVEPEKSPEEKEMERGGRIGKGIRASVKLGKIPARIGKSILDDIADSIG